MPLSAMRSDIFAADFLHFSLLLPLIFDYFSFISLMAPLAPMPLLPLPLRCHIFASPPFSP